MFVGCLRNLQYISTPRVQVEMVTEAYRATDVRPSCKTQRIALTLRQVAALVCAPSKEREYFKTCIVGHVNCCLQCGPTLTATPVLQISHDKSRHFQCGSSLGSGRLAV
ncbi:hypothetical protein PoB_002407800 [Plakobranchus ocellatus]|uniref:Uncharacterized protein n=1 Tax=Plakobranchus ocellatus TaxID=259542 RepID=A0AAV3ZSU5_9GAST|nr:hypothetical protein PoB_002407800 [Plakobranchus ocellatus]